MTRNHGTIWAGFSLTYRTPAQISIQPTPGLDIGSYPFGAKIFHQKLCSVCGVPVVVDDTVDDMKGHQLEMFEEVLVE